MIGHLSQATGSRRRATRVGVIGSGAIGLPVIDALLKGRVPGCILAGILTRSPLSADLAGLAASSLYDLIDRSDLIVEAAGHDALEKLGPPIIENGRDLLVLSVGALVDDDLFARLTPDRGGRLLVSTGAVGGLDTLSAAMLVEPLESVSLTSRKPAKLLVRPWMSTDLQLRLSSASQEVEACNGSAREVVKLFPESANIAATLALATVGFDRLKVRMVGVPDDTYVEHCVTAMGRAGSYKFVFQNRPADLNPRTSAIVPFSVIRALRGLQNGTIIGV